MRLRTGLLICCCIGLAACTAGAPKGPDVTVSTPNVGRPQPPSSVQAALYRMAFTPYAALGQSDNDGLAPGESSYALAQACLTAAGYPGAGNVPFAVSLGPANLSFAQPWGAWGYLGTAAAQQYGFRAPAGSVLSSLGIDTNPAAPDPADLPQAEQTAIGKCTTIGQDFTDAVTKGPLAGILTLSNDIASDVRKDAAVKTATQRWGACMARNGYDYQQPQNVFFDQIQKMFGGKRQIIVGATVSAAANQAQIAAAVTDATCTGSADLAGIYLAVQASYEQQIVNANAQALNSAVQQYKAAYAKELKKLPSLLKTAKANAFPPVRPTRTG
ncbi:MAG: hypothetical protein ACRDPF_13015 [Streptosporangiaceae bacterium]